ncbi:MAG: (2Fe-2S)-binding protein [Acidobacteria bacterium]|nr:(2Fe-2S)-binding protein [Acidobacteriota bacterium]
MEDELQSLHPAVQGLRVVCRCNNVKYRTIEKAIREGCTTIAQIAARTTATTGHCGGTCTPKIHDMIDAIGAEEDGCAATGGER